jgi:hypothetical protein
LAGRVLAKTIYEGTACHDLERCSTFHSLPPDTEYKEVFFWREPEWLELKKYLKVYFIIILLQSC